MKNFTLMTLIAFMFTTLRLVAQPTNAPTTPPARNAGDVISLFSDAYTNVAGTIWFPNWGQSTVVTDEVIAGNNVKKYATLNYQGIQFQDPIVPVNAASMTHLHVDIWTPNCTAFDVFLINTTPATVEHAYTITPTLSGWNSIDIPLTAFTSSAPVIALNNIGQFKLVGTPFGSSTVWLDNLYFWKPDNVPTITGFTVPEKVVGDAPFTLTAPTSNSPGAFTYTSDNTGVATISGSTVTIVGAGTSLITANQAPAGGFAAGTTSATLVVTSPGPSTAAPTPTVAAANVTSLFSNAYTNVGIDTWSAVWDVADVADVTIAGNDTKKYTNHTYSGIEFTGANMIDATSRTHFHADIWTADAAGADGFKVKLVDFGANGVYDGGDDANSIELPFTPTASGWFAIDVPLSSFTGLTTKAHLAQMVLVTPGGGKTFWLDNVYLYNTPAVVVPTVAAPTPTRPAANVTSLFSNAYTDLAGTNWNPGWGQTTVYTEVMIAGNATKKYENLNYQGAEPAATVDLTSRTHLHFDAWAASAVNFRVKLVDFGANGAFGGGDDTEHELEYTLTGNTWDSKDVSLSSFTGMMAKGHLGQFIISSTTSPSPTVWVDNIYFWATATQPTITNFTVPAKTVGDAAFTLTAPTSNSTGAFTYTSSNTSVATISGTTVTIVGGGTSIITATQAAAGGYASGSISANLVVSFAAPTIAAQTPTAALLNVISLFSNAYTNVAGTDWFPNWGQSTVVSDITIAGNATKKYDNLNYQGVQFASSINASGMEFLHIDLWTPNCTAFDVFLINTTPATVEQAYTLSPTLNGWNSFDIPLTAYNTIALNNIGQFKLVGTPFGSSIVYLDNIYFWKAPIIPVELTLFKAKAVNNTTILNWQTASERDNQGFTIERSTNGTTYNAIGQVKGNGSTSKVSDYTFTDNSPSSSINYYRLRQTDFNGKETLSSVVSTFFGKNGLIIKDNLVKNTLDVTVRDESPTPLSIFNLSGQQMYSGKVQGTQRIDVSHFAAGLYIVRTASGEVSRFVKE
jgi:hypothetical protein